MSSSLPNPGSTGSQAGSALSKTTDRKLMSRGHSLTEEKGVLNAFNAATGPSKCFPVHQAQLLVNGESFYVIEQGEGPAVLFCHGFPDTSETWRSQMLAVANAGYRAVAMDMRGFGKSYAPSDPNLYSALQIVADMVGVLDALSIQSAVVVGHDWGADHAQHAMLMRPDRFRALVSLSIPFAPQGEASNWDQLRARGLGELYYALEMMTPEGEARLSPAETTIPSFLYWLSGSAPAATRWNPIVPALTMLRPAPEPVPSWAHPEYVRHTIRSFEMTGFHTGLNHYRGMQTTFELMSAFKGAVITQPSLYIWGAADGLCLFFHPDTPTLAELRQAQPGLVKQVRIENAGHWLQHEAAQQVNDELVNFLGAI